MNEWEKVFSDAKKEVLSSLDNLGKRKREMAITKDGWESAVQIKTLRNGVSMVTEQDVRDFASALKRR